jgi:peptidoglycan/LPS O-acetylase OafA/YrhL
VAYLVLATYAAALFVTQQIGITRFDNWLLGEYRPPLWSFATFTQSLPIAFAATDEGPRWMAMTWSLAIEEQFYLLFPLAVYFLPRRGIVAITIAGIVAAPLFRVWLEQYFGHWYSAYVLLPARMDALFFGVAVALIIRNEIAFAVARRLRFLLDAVALYILYMTVNHLWFQTGWFHPPGTYPLKHGLFAVMAAIMILRLFTYRRSLFNMIWRFPPLAYIGLISYALYMYHQAVNGLVHGIVFNQVPTISTTAHLVAAIAIVVIATALAGVSYVYFEMPIRRRAAAFVARLETEKEPAISEGLGISRHMGLTKRTQWLTSRNARASMSGHLRRAASRFPAHARRLKCPPLFKPKSAGP